MIKRRSVRIKVLQSLYGFEHGDGLPLSNYIQQLQKSILSVRCIYFYQLLVIRSLIEMVQQEADVRASKHIRSSEDHNFNTKLLSNVFYKVLQGHETLDTEIKKCKLTELLDDVLLQNCYKDFKEEAAYKEYIERDGLFDVKEDLELIRFLYQDFLLARDDFHQHMLDLWSNWIDDAGFVSSAVLLSIEKSKHQLYLVHEKGNFEAKLEELSNFGKELLVASVNGRERQLELISTKLKNWDIERLASTDILILRIALAELLNFPTIPTKVSINEYIDIAKEYSTPKSKEFVNGILDNLTRELKDKGIILKEGRGLKES